MSKKRWISIVIIFFWGSIANAENSKENKKYAYPFISACVSSNAEVFDKCGLISRDGKTVTPAKYNVIDKYPDIWLALKENGDTDVLDSDGNVVGTISGTPQVPPRGSIIKIADNLLFSAKAHALYDYSGTLIHALKSSENYSDYGVSDGMISALRITDSGVKRGYMDIHTGTWILEPIYSSISEFKQGYASVSVKKEGEFYSTIIDKKGKELFPLSLDTSFHWISNNRWIKSYDSSGMRGLVDILNEKGEVLLSQVTVEPYSFSEHAVIVQKQQNAGCYVVKLPSMEEQRISERCRLSKFSDGVIWIKRFTGEEKNSEWALFDEYGKELFRMNYRNVSAFHNGFAVVVDNNEKWGVIDKKGETVIPFEYSKIGTPWRSFRQPIYEGVWRVRKNGVKGDMYIDNNNHVIATLTRDNISQEGPCSQYNPMTLLKNEQGKILWQEDLEETCKAVNSYKQSRSDASIR
ncbi:WG repeat-containing protein [Leminorella grimontii]|uniref:WG repeat-containing protein n=1 Tax=Leminorella grimontii TaxID=82981 RepID=UPI00207F41C5|nr:WG repeat-containing protein [Leminorella grimontii]GKX61166.1 hypothetical protein SOASR031_34810 [Leminorella grimontii]